MRQCRKKERRFVCVRSTYRFAIVYGICLSSVPGMQRNQNDGVKLLLSVCLCVRHFRVHAD